MRPSNQTPVATSLFRTAAAILVLLLAAWPLAAGAADESAEILTLKQCIEIVMEKSPALESAAQDVTKAEWQKKKAFTGYLPRLSLQYSYTQLDETPSATLAIPSTTIRMPAPIGPVTIPGSRYTYDVGTRDNWGLKTTLTQPLFTGFALLSQNKLAELGLDAAKIGLEQANMDLILQVKSSYFGILQAEKGVEIATQSQKQLEAHLDVARNFFDVGMVPKNHVLQAEVQLAQAVQRLIIAQHQLRYSQAALNTLLRRDLEATVRVEDILKLKPFGMTLDACIEQSLKTRPEVLAAGRRIEMGHQNVRIAKSGYYPTVALTYNYKQEGDDWDVAGGLGHEPNSWDVTVAAQWNIFEWGATRDEVQSSRADLSKARLALTQVQDAVRLEVKQNFLQLRAAEQNISVAEKAQEQAVENYRMSEERYREQVATSTEVMDAETLLTSARNNYYGALYQYNLAWASLERAMGLGVD